MYTIEPINFFGRTFDKVEIVVTDLVLNTSARITGTIISTDGGTKISNTVDLIVERRFVRDGKSSGRTWVYNYLTKEFDVKRSHKNI